MQKIWLIYAMVAGFQTLHHATLFCLEKDNVLFYIVDCIHSDYLEEQIQQAYIFQFRQQVEHTEALDEDSVQENIPTHTLFPILSSCDLNLWPTYLIYTDKNLHSKFCRHARYLLIKIHSRCHEWLNSLSGNFSTSSNCNFDLRDMYSQVLSLRRLPTPQDIIPEITSQETVFLFLVRVTLTLVIPYAIMQTTNIQFYCHLSFLASGNRFFYIE